MKKKTKIAIALLGVAGVGALAFAGSAKAAEADDDDADDGEPDEIDLDGDDVTTSPGLPPIEAPSVVRPPPVQAPPSPVVLQPPTIPGQPQPAPVPVPAPAEPPPVDAELPEDDDDEEVDLPDGIPPEVEDIIRQLPKIPGLPDAETILTGGPPAPAPAPVPVPAPAPEPIFTTLPPITRPKPPKIQPAPTVPAPAQPVPDLTGVDPLTIQMVGELLEAEKSPGWKREYGILRQWQDARGLVKDGKFGPTSALNVAAMGVGTIPIVRYWPKAAGARPDLALDDYRAALGEIASKSSPPKAELLRMSAERETGQSFGPPQGDNGKLPISQTFGAVG